MNRPIIFTHRAVLLPGWRSAFPAAQIAAFPDDVDTVNVDHGVPLWLHVDTHVSDPARQVAVLRSALPDNPVVVLSNVPRDDEGLSVLASGAAGYVGALADAGVLRQIESVVSRGGLWVGPSLLSRLLKTIAAGGGSHQSRTAPYLDSLSPREREVALAVAGGATNKEVARQLNITERTVKAHLSSIFQTLQVRDRLQLVIYVGRQSEGQAERLPVK